MKVLIFGAFGLLGKSLLQEWNGDEVIGLGSREADIRDAQRLTTGQRQVDAEVVR